MKNDVQDVVSASSIMQQMETSWDTRHYLQHEASHGKKAQTTKRHLRPLEVKTHDRQTHVCKLKKVLYKLRRNPWDNTYMKSLNITYSDEDLNLCYKVEDESLQRMTSSQMGVRRTFSRQRILVSSDPRWIHRILVVEEDTFHYSTKIFNTQSTKGRGRMILHFRGSDCRRY